MVKFSKVKRIKFPCPVCGKKTKLDKDKTDRRCKDEWVYTYMMSSWYVWKKVWRRCNEYGEVLKN